MKKFICCFTTLFFLCYTLQAALSFDSAVRYKMVCKCNPQGCLVLGEKHGSSALILYHLSDNTPEDGWWYIEKASKGYTIRNAATSEYIIYDPVRQETVKKGLALSTTLQGDATEWYIEPIGDHFVIKSVAMPSQWFNIRYGRDNLTGTYNGTGGNNELFSFYDHYGRKVGNGSTTDHSSTDFVQSFDSLLFNGKQLVFDNKHQCYFYPLPDSVRMGKTFNINLHYALKSESGNRIVTLDTPFKSHDSGVYSITSPDCHTKYSMTLWSYEGQKISSCELKFTYLPIVEIKLDNCNSNGYNAGNIRVTDGNKAGYDTLFNATFKYRGNTSLWYDKKSFNIKLKDAFGQSMDRSFLGLRSDNRWILDAMMIDKSCLRNRVAMDLWNDFATKPYYADREPKVRTGTRGKFVEVFWNGNYHGLFCLSERIDRKQLDIKKFLPSSISPSGTDEIHGLLYKAKEWSYEVFMGHHSDSEYLPGSYTGGYSNQLGQERWGTFELKYPDCDTEGVDWEPLYNAVNFTATSSQYRFDREIGNYFDLPVVLDYYLFLEILLATDNHGKNMYYFVYDKSLDGYNKLSIAPWDLDAILGINWQSVSDFTTPDWNFDDYIRTYEHGQNTLFIKLRNSKLIPWRDLLAQRYAQLRPTFFDKEKLLDRIRNYAELFAISGADTREETLWGGWHSDLQGGSEYIINWLDQRIQTLDEQYGYDPVSTSINNASAQEHMAIYGQTRAIYISCDKAQNITVFNLAGQAIRQVHLSEGLNTVSDLEPGIYIVDKQKVIVR